MPSAPLCEKCGLAITAVLRSILLGGAKRHGSSTACALVVSDQLAFVTTLALGSPCVTYTAAARDVKRTQLTDATPSFADQPAQPPETVVNAVLNAWRLTGIDPALLLTIAWTESRFRAEAKNQTSSAAGLLQFTKQTWLERHQDLWPKAWLEPFDGPEFIESGAGRLVVHASRQEQNVGA